MTLIRSLTVLAVVLTTGEAFAEKASPAVTIQARMFMKESAQLDADLFANGDRPTVRSLDYGVLADEMLVIVGVPDGVGDKLAVTVTQGKAKQSRTWKVTAGSVYGIKVAHYPILVTPDPCTPMTITAKVGTTTTTRTINFACDE